RLLRRRHRGGQLARVGRADPARLRPALLPRHREEDRRLRQARPGRQAQHRRADRRHLLDHQRRRVRLDALDADHQPAAIGDPGRARDARAPGCGERPGRDPPDQLPRALVRPPHHRRPRGGAVAGRAQGTAGRPVGGSARSIRKSGGVVLTGRLALMPLACAMMTGCGTIFTGTTDDIKFTANIPNVRLTIDKQPKGVIPITVKQSRGFMNGESFTAKFEEDGYETQEFQLKRNFNTVAVLDITSIPPSGGIDFITGSLMRFEPTEYHIEMRKKGKSSAEFEHELRAWR